MYIQRVIGLSSVTGGDKHIHTYTFYSTLKSDLVNYR